MASRPWYGGGGQFGTLMPIHRAGQSSCLCASAPPFPFDDALRQPPLQGHRRRPGRRCSARWPAHLPSAGVQWLVLRGLAWTLAFEILVLSFVPFERMATRALVRRREGGRAARVRRRLAAAPAPARASGAVKAAFTGLLLPGMLLLHSGPPAGRQLAGAHHEGGAQGGRAPGRARADGGGARGRARGGAQPGQRGDGAGRGRSEAAREEDLDVEGGCAVVDEARREENDPDPGGGDDDEDHSSRRSGAPGPAGRRRAGESDRSGSGRRDRRGRLSLPPRTPLVRGACDLAHGMRG